MTIPGNPFHGPNFRLRYYPWVPVTIIALVWLGFAHVMGYIGHTPRPGEQYTFIKAWYQSKSNPFTVNHHTTNTVLAVRDGYVLSVDQFGYTNSEKLPFFRFMYNARLK